MYKVVMLFVIVILAITSIIGKHNQQLKFVDLQKLYTQYNELLIVNKQLKTKHSEQSSLIKIEQKAVKNLKMVFPKEADYL